MGRPKFTFTFLDRFQATQINTTQIYTQPKKRSAGAVYVSNRARHSNQARRALGSQRPHSNRVSSNRVRQLSQSVCMGVTLSLGWLGKPEPRSGGAVYVSNRVRHSNQARRALGSRRPHSNRVSSNRVRQLSQSVYSGVTLSFGWLGKPEPRSGGAVYVSNR